MNQEATFVYTYSAKQNKELQEIRKRYLPRKESSLDTLKALDRKVRRPANIFAYFFGSVSAIVMGSGMSLVMTDIGSVVGIGDPMIFGVLIGIAGLSMALLTYPIYQGILASRRKKYTDKILTLSDKIIKGEEQ